MNISRQEEKMWKPNVVWPTSSSYLSPRGAFINSKECRPPPMEISFVQKRKSFSFCKHKRRSQEEEKSRLSSFYSCPVEGWSSGRSLASSITFTDRDDIDEDDLDELLATTSVSAPFRLEHDSKNSDLKPFIPTRQRSIAKLLCEHDGPPPSTSANSNKSSPRSVSRAVIDSPPTQPRRCCSFASIGAAEEGKETVTDTPRRIGSSVTGLRLRPEGTVKTTARCHPSLPKLPFCVTKQKNSKSDIARLAQKAARFYAIVTPEVKDNGTNQSQHKKCFVGSIAIDRMIETGLCHTRDEAVVLGRDLMKTFSLFRHVSSTETFKDKANAFYRFWDGEQQQNSVKTKRWSALSVSRMTDEARLPLSTTE